MSNKSQASGKNSSPVNCPSPPVEIEVSRVLYSAILDATCVRTGSCQHASMARGIARIVPQEGAAAPVAQPEVELPELDEDKAELLTRP